MVLITHLNASHIIVEVSPSHRGRSALSADVTGKSQFADYGLSISRAPSTIAQKSGKFVAKRL